MAKIQPLPAAASQSPSSADERQTERIKQAVYTVWMKSLVFNGNGCTVYGADGGVAYRVDNYGCRGGREVFFMDRAGRTLLTIRRRGFGVFKRWEAFRHVDGEEDAAAAKTNEPWFRVDRNVRRRNGAEVKVLGVGTARAYRVDGCSRKAEFRISGADDGAVVAAIARKQTAAGVVLGEDVLTLSVGSDVDHLLVLGLVVVSGLMNRCL